jgi:hypothetical protein
MLDTTYHALTRSTAAALALCLAGLPGLTSAGEQAAESGQTQGAQVMSAQDALQAMSGMAGYYRRAPNGDTYLYPGMKLSSDMKGMYGSYSVSPHGIILHPVGMAAQDLSMSSMGGVVGYFRVTPDNKAHFYPAPKAPTGMSGMTGRPGE